MLMTLISTENRFHGPHFCCRQCMPISTVLGVVSCQIWQNCHKKIQRKQSNSKGISIRSVVSIWIDYCQP